MSIVRESACMFPRGGEAYRWSRYDVRGGGFWLRYAAKPLSELVFSARCQEEHQRIGSVSKANFKIWESSGVG
jgi:hypothetical protein